MTRFIAGNIYLTGSDKKKSLETMFDILDLNNDGFLSQNEIEKVCIATRSREEGQNFGHLNDEFNTFEKNGKEEAEKLMKKLDTKNEGRVSKEVFLNAMFKEPEFETFRKRFNINEQLLQHGNVYTDPGSVPVALGDLLRD
jgi:Ca2+-binding EF-hand superfamily protein